MPCLGMKCRICLAEFPLHEVIEASAALDHFETFHGEKYCINRDFLYTMALDEQETNRAPRRNGTHVTASMTGGCWREAALKRTVGWWLDPHRGYMRVSGTLIHESLKVPAPWQREVEFFEAPILGGMIIGGTVDRLNRETRIVRDVKTHKCPEWKWKYPTPAERSMGQKPFVWYNPKAYPPGDGDTNQVNVLMRLVERAEYDPAADDDDQPEYTGEITPIFMGCAEVSLSSPLPRAIPRLSDEELIARIRPHYDEFQMVMSEPDLDKRLVLIGKMALQGREMFKARDGSCKCDRYCDLRQACDEQLPAELRF